MDVARTALATASLLFASVYLGTGVTLVFFLFPIGPKLTPETYRLPFVEPVQAATKLFTVMTLLMLLTASTLTILELGSLRWILPAVYVVLTVVSTLLTTRVIFKHNAAMAAGISDPVQLQNTISAWRKLNSVRAALWAGEWAAIVGWFVVRLS